MDDLETTIEQQEDDDLKLDGLDPGEQSLPAETDMELLQLNQIIPDAPEPILCVGVGLFCAAVVVGCSFLNMNEFWSRLISIQTAPLAGILGFGLAKLLLDFSGLYRWSKGVGDVEDMEGALAIQYAKQIASDPLEQRDRQQTFQSIHTTRHLMEESLLARSNALAIAAVALLLIGFLIFCWRAKEDFEAGLPSNHLPLIIASALSGSILFVGAIVFSLIAKSHCRSWLANALPACGLEYANSLDELAHVFEPEPPEIEEEEEPLDLNLESIQPKTLYPEPDNEELGGSDYFDDDDQQSPWGDDDADDESWGE